jgi:hypothetical protein
MGSGVFIGSLVDAGIWIFFGVYLQFFAAKFVEMRIQQGKLRPEKRARLIRSGRWLGGIFILLGLIQLAEAWVHHQ